jgi:hypothetical protein
MSNQKDNMAATNVIEAIFNEILSHQKEFPVSGFDPDYKENFLARYIQEGNPLLSKKPLKRELEEKLDKLKSRMIKDYNYFCNTEKSFLLERLKYHLGAEEKNEELDKTFSITLFASFTLIYFLLFSSASSVDNKLRKASILIPVGTVFVSFADTQEIRRTRYLGHLVNIEQNKSNL